MGKYVIELQDFDECEDCPCGDTASGCMGHGYILCNLTHKVPPARYEAGEFSPYQFAHHDRPDWCPMVELGSDPSMDAKSERIASLESDVRRQREKNACLAEVVQTYEDIMGSRTRQIHGLFNLAYELCDMVDWSDVSVEKREALAKEMGSLGVSAPRELRREPSYGDLMELASIEVAMKGVRHGQGA